ncbi:MAG: hypothetical protein H7A47_02820 [Verrucomicrobiales bacterium]|nr:hypothetical protein [Verrucomicrobiales bacterium]
MISRLLFSSALTAIATLAQAPAGEVSAEPAPKPAVRAEVPPLKPTPGPTSEPTVVAEAGWPMPSLPDAVLLGQTQPTAARSQKVLDPVAARELTVVRARYGGLLGEALIREQPWQLVNPFAPAGYGDGTQNLTQDPFTGRGEGLVLFSIRLGGGGSGKSLAERRAPSKSTPTKPAPTPSAGDAATE